MYGSRGWLVLMVLYCGIYVYLPMYVVIFLGYWFCCIVLYYIILGPRCLYLSRRWLVVFSSVVWGKGVNSMARDGDDTGRFTIRCFLGG
ncbi:uncharacterized protein F4817DRAFT_330933 [Daldinia loculata]|uniref:uncharacterized protein n=1 Tax=Daldinia loculata TaxID=103429 RepID=UPI0020C50F43|nr:uncharacterized protein F4817DRAFT_330933 [Daldinia loculata]KAI1649625.1 hypothetical protein F4817DRAFT_330933 [Daldinia loculata]